MSEKRDADYLAEFIERVDCGDDDDIKAKECLDRLRSELARVEKERDEAGEDRMLMAMDSNRWEDRAQSAEAALEEMRGKAEALIKTGRDAGITCYIVQGTEFDALRSLIEGGEEGKR